MGEGTVPEIDENNKEAMVRSIFTSLHILPEPQTKNIVSCQCFQFIEFN